MFLCIAHLYLGIDDQIRDLLKLANEPGPIQPGNTKSRWSLASRALGPPALVFAIVFATTYKEIDIKVLMRELTEVAKGKFTILNIFGLFFDSYQAHML